MAVLSSLKLVMSKHTREKSPALQRRQKLLTRKFHEEVGGTAGKAL